MLSTQQFVADSAALLNELPGTEGRSVFVAAPRSFNPDPAAARRFFAAAASIPWLTPTTTDAALAPGPPGGARPPAAPVTRPTAPATGGRRGADHAPGSRELEQTVRTVRGVAQIRDDGDAFLRTWTRAAEQLASTRWRAAPTAWNTLSGRVSAGRAGRPRPRSRSSASTINFLADSGRLQITVTNDLAVPVDNVKLTVEASNPRLRIDSQPSVLRIGPRSRATVDGQRDRARGRPGAPADHADHPRRHGHRPGRRRPGPGHPHRALDLLGPGWGGGRDPAARYRAHRPARPASTARSRPADPVPTPRRPPDPLPREASPA